MNSNSFDDYFLTRGCISNKEKLLQYRNKIIEKDEELLTTIERYYKNNIDNYFFIKGKEYEDTKIYHQMLTYYLLSIEMENSVEAMFRLGYYYETVKNDYFLTIKYYSMALNQDHSNSIFRLGLLYHLIFANYEFSVNYYLRAIKYNHTTAMNNIAAIYHGIYNNSSMAKKYYQMGADRGNSLAMHNLGKLFYKENSTELSLKYFLMAVEENFKDSINFVLEILSSKTIVSEVDLSNVNSINFEDMEKIRHIISENVSFSNNIDLSLHYYFFIFK